MNLPAAFTKIDHLLSGILQHSGLRLTYVVLTKEPDVAIRVVFEGPDVPLLLDRRAELLLAFEHLAVQAVGLTSDEHDQISFDAGGFKSDRDSRIESSARNAVEHVQALGVPFHFPPMNSRERRLLHLALAPSGLLAASEGEEPHRHLVLHPAGSSTSSLSQ